jgi:hypothetical protein
MLTAACSDTGMLIKTSTTADFDHSIQSVRFYVGTESSDDPLHWIDRGSVEDIDLNGRDIGEEPYRLLLNPRGSDMGEIIVAAVAYSDTGDLIGFGRLESPVSFVDGSVLTWDLLIGNARGDIFVNDAECLEFPLDNGEYVTIATGDDKDCDGSPADEDCNDNNADQSPDVPEDCFNEIDDDCNGLADGEDTIDEDKDGYANCGDNGGDCHDRKDTINPAAEEVCDGVDNNCDYFCDDGFDGDNDGVSTCGSFITGDDNASFCYAMGDSDCDDQNRANFPGNIELCDGRDNNCDGECDNENLDTFDGDDDGYTTCGSRVGYCLGTDPAWNDCVDDDAFVHPGKHELCDNKDNDCNDAIDDLDRVPCFENVGGDQCHQGRIICEGGQFIGECQYDANATYLDNNWCDTYETCDSYVDPYFCSLLEAQNVGTPQSCLVRMQTPTQMCGGSNVVKFDLSSAVGDQCRYHLIGGGQQQGYKVSLIDPAGGNPSSLLVDVCAVGLQVSLPGPQWPEDADISILFIDSDGEDQEIRLELTAELVENCDGPALVCEGLDPGIPPAPML